MRLPMFGTKTDDTKTETVKWPTVDFQHDMAAKIVKAKKKKKKKDADGDFDGSKTKDD